MNKLVRVMTALYCEPWLIVPEMHKTLCDIVSQHAGTADMQAAQHALAMSMPKNGPRKEYQTIEGVAVIPVEGVIGRKFSSVLQSSGVTSVDILEGVVNQAFNDPDVKSLMMVFDTPGGTASGIEEVSATMAGHNRKPITAFVDGMCASAGYWLASGCDQIMATPSADVGSVGVYMAIMDKSRMAEMQGIKVEMIKSGKHKGMGYPGTSLTDEQRDMLQKRVDSLGAQFRAAVRSGRDRDIKDELMQGQSFGAKEALAYGLIDGIGNFNEALREATLLTQTQPRRR